MVNLFAMEMLGIPFNNADSKRKVDGQDYEIEIIKNKIKNVILIDLK